MTCASGSPATRRSLFPRRRPIQKTPPSNGKKKTKPIEIIGTGMFDSGIPDLATNKKHLEGLGKSSMGRKYRKITGAGQFNSGVPDLATNKKYMEGFGES